MRTMPAAMRWLVLVLVLTGCAGLGKGIEPPEVSLVDLRIERMRPMEATFRVKLRVLNPNPAPLTLTGLDCHIAIEGQPIARGVVPIEQQVAPFATVIVPMQVYASMIDMATTVIDLIGRARSGGPQPVKYAVNGRVGVRSGRWATPRLAFSSEGRIDLRGLARKPAGID